MNFITYSFIAGFLIMAVSLIGVIFTGQKLKNWMMNNLKFLVTFSAGIFLFASFNLIGESFEIAGELEMKNLAFFSILLGFLTFLLSQKIIPESHHHHEDDENHSHNKSGVMRMLVGDGIHNIGDGIILVSAFAIDFKIGIVAMVGILVHETLQEISEFFVLRNLGLTIREALIRNFIVSSTILIGIAIGAMASGNEKVSLVLLGFAGGAFIYIVFNDLIPYREFKQKNFWKHILFFIIGFLIIFAIKQVTPHSHEFEKIDEIIISDDHGRDDVPLQNL